MNISLISLVKRYPWIQNIIGSIYVRCPAMMEHNLGKYHALKKAFYLTALENLHGDYLEFGVFTGGSFVFATKAHRTTCGVSKVTTAFFGFDSFKGFGAQAAEDMHPFYTDQNFAVCEKRIVSNIKKQTKHEKVTLVSGFFEKTLSHDPSLYGIKAARIIFIDCDLKDPALLALRFSRQLIQKGTILMMDDFYSYRGAPDLGVSGAYNQFLHENSQISTRRLFDYGYGGVGVIFTAV